MAFRLQPKESPCTGIKRCISAELKRALGYLQGTKDEDEAVHEARKCIKRVRAALRLFRDELGCESYQRENFFFRDVARPLTEVRDAAVFIESLDELMKDFPNQLEASELSKVRAGLIADKKAVAERVLKKSRALATLARAILPALARVHSFPLHDRGLASLRGGFYRSYRAGYRKLHAVKDQPTVENLHEWRKQAKYLWHQLQLLDPFLLEQYQALGEQAHRLTQLLGADHDLAVLRQILTNDPLSYGGRRVLSGLLPLLEDRRKELQRQALILGQHVYHDQPKIFIEKVEEFWKAKPRRRADSQALKPIST